jgi:hypothetical protein
MIKTDYLHLITGRMFNPLTIPQGINNGLAVRNGVEKMTTDTRFIDDYNNPPRIEEVKASSFGCRNCLWASIECKNYEKFQPEWKKKIPSCKAYTYYD